MIFFAGIRETFLQNCNRTRKNIFLLFDGFESLLYTYNFYHKYCLELGEINERVVDRFACKQKNLLFFVYLILKINKSNMRILKFMHLKLKAKKYLSRSLQN